MDLYNRSGLGGIGDRARSSESRGYTARNNVDERTSVNERTSITERKHGRMRPKHLLGRAGLLLQPVLHLHMVRRGTILSVPRAVMAAR
jgi:hypothetical protein